MDRHLWIQLVIAFLCLIAVMAKDYYEILGVQRDANEKEIKRRFRQLGN
jgi:preprotein translocase subunit Sec63